MTIITDGDLARALILLPEPRFRQADVYEVAVALGFRKREGQTLWNRLRDRGLIVRTAHPIGNYRGRFYWERTVRP